MDEKEVKRSEPITISKATVSWNNEPEQELEEMPEVMITHEQKEKLRKINEYLKRLSEQIDKKIQEELDEEIARKADKSMDLVSKYRGEN